MSEPIRRANEPSFPSKSEPSHPRLDATPPLTLPASSTNTHSNSEHPLHSHHAAEKAKAIAEKAATGSAIHETEQLFESGCPKNGAAIIAFTAIKVFNPKS